MIMERITRRVVGNNVWLSDAQPDPNAQLLAHGLNYEVMESEEAVGRAMLAEIEAAARSKEGDLTIILLGGRGAQAMHSLIGEQARTNKLDHLLNRLHVSHRMLWRRCAWKIASALCGTSNDCWVRTFSAK